MKEMPVVRPDVGVRDSEVGPDGLPWPNPDVDNSNGALKAPKAEKGRSLLVSIAAFSALLSTSTLTGDTPIIEKEVPQIENTVAEKTEVAAPLDESLEREKFDKAKTMLKEATTLLMSNRLEEEIPMFRPVPEPKNTEACTFLDNWYKPQKANLNTLWHYAELHRNEWNQDLKDSMMAALEVSKVAAGILNWAVVPKKYHAPTTLEELYVRLDTKLAIPASPDSSCGFWFNRGYDYLQSKHQAPNIQKLFRKMVLGFSLLISTELEKHVSGERSSDYVAAEKLGEIVQALLPSSTH